MINIGIAGATGRMGRAIIKEIVDADQLKLVAALSRRGNPSLGMDAGTCAGVQELGIALASTIKEQTINVFVDFSKPSALQKNLDLCVKQSTAIVVGTTGLNEQQNQLMSEAAKHIPVLYAANTSVGVNLCVALVDMASRVLGGTCDIEIIEAHHKHKVDAPSGTALLLGEAAAAAQDTDLASTGVFSREGNTGERQSGSIGFSTIRGGDIAGEHTVMFIGESERIEITHRTSDRKIFAQGALRGAIWLSKQKKGLFSMQDVLDLR